MRLFNWIGQVEQRLDSEETRAHYYLSPSTWGAVRTIVEANLLAPHLQTIVSMAGSGLDVMVDGNRLEDLNRMYRLFFHVSTSTGGPQALQKGLKESIIARGKIINESNDRSNAEATEDTKGKPSASTQTQNLTVALKWVQDALDLKDKFDTILKRALMNDRACELAITEVCVKFFFYKFF
jgi:cullin 3